MRIAIDTGGTFTDLVLLDGNNRPRMYKAPTTPSNPPEGILKVIALAAEEQGVDLRAFLAGVEQIVHGTTYALNAIITGNTAKTALLVTQGHPDILTLREGGKTDPFDVRTAYPQPYIPRSRTFEIRERILSTGEIAVQLDEASVESVAARLEALECEAVAVCLLWSVVNGKHEIRVGEILRDRLPGIACTLSHQLNPCVREFRRASSAAIDASLKPVMTRYLSSLEKQLHDAGFGGVIRVVTSLGGTMRAEEICKAPIHALNSGPATAPIMGRAYSSVVPGTSTAVVIDTGGTTFDLSLIRGGSIPWTREKWIGPPIDGLMTGFPSIDIQSIGAGGGSIAWVDAGGLLHVGPRSAGSVPGPACYGNGGFAPTVTDAALILGYLDPEKFLGGKRRLSRELAQQAIAGQVAAPLAISIEQAAMAIFDVITEKMAQAIESVALYHGTDLSNALLIVGGGAGGLNAVRIAERLSCPWVVVPPVAAAISAAGALIAPLMADFEETYPVRLSEIDRGKLASVLSNLKQKAHRFLVDIDALESGEFSVACEARYTSGAWEIDVPLPIGLLERPDPQKLRSAFDAAHETSFGFSDQGRDIQFLTWRVRATSGTSTAGPSTLSHSFVGDRAAEHGRRQAFFSSGWVSTPTLPADSVSAEYVAGPLIIESEFTSTVVSPCDLVRRNSDGSLIIKPGRMPADSRNRAASDTQLVKALTIA